MARATLTPTVCAADNVANGLSANATTTVTSGAGNGVQFLNSNSFLVVNVGATPTTLTVVVGSLILGQSVTPFSIGPLTASNSYIIGPFHTALNLAGTSLVAIDFSSSATITVGSFMLSGVS